MYGNMLLYAFGMLYLSFCVGFWLKLYSYGIKRNKIRLSIFGPLMVFISTNRVAWSYIDVKAKEAGVNLTFISKLFYMLRLVRLNIQWFPVFVGFKTEAILRAEKSKVVVKEDAKKRQSNRVFRSKSYEFYDDCHSYGFI